ncbi:MAG: subclass B3 metallo-beta-lactamase [Sphingomonas sp.]|jgi:metallo-beta-lactamase class B
MRIAGATLILALAGASPILALAGASPILALASATAASAAADPPAWTEPTAAFPVIGPIHYVGTRGLAAYLIKTSAGAILIDPTMEENVPAIERNIIASGVPLKSVRILLNSHAHFDHAAGFARLKRDTGARVMIMDRDADAIRRGMPRGDNRFATPFPAAPVDQVLKDGERVTLGGVTLTAWRTAGHTPGCTTWTMTVIDTVANKGRPRRVIFPCSLSIAGNVLVGNKSYPGIADDYRASFARLKSMRADIVLTAHPEFSDVFERAARARHGERDAWLNPRRLGSLVVESQQNFYAELAREQSVKDTK